MAIPDPVTRQTPDIAGFRDAMDRKRAQLGSEITFFWPPQNLFGEEIPLDPISGVPMDPMASAMSSTQASATVTAAAFFKAINRGGAANADVATPIGRDSLTRVFLNVASGDAVALNLETATEFEFHGNRFQIYVSKWDEVVQGYKRFLVYAAGEGNDE